MPSSAGRPGPATGGWWSFGRRSTRYHDALLTGMGEFGPCVTAQVRAMLAGVDHDEAQFALRLCVRLRPLVQRSVPPRLIEAGPAPGAARLRFADGTTLVVTSVVPGDLAVLANVMRQCSAKPVACGVDPDGGTHMLFSWANGRAALVLRVVGFDQPD